MSLKLRIGPSAPSEVPAEVPKICVTVFIDVPEPGKAQLDVEFQVANHTGILIETDQSHEKTDFELLRSDRNPYRSPDFTCLSSYLGRHARRLDRGDLLDRTADQNWSIYIHDHSGSHEHAAFQRSAATNANAGAHIGPPPQTLRIGELVDTMLPAPNDRLVRLAGSWLRIIRPAASPAATQGAYTSLVVEVEVENVNCRSLHLHVVAPPSYRFGRPRYLASNNGSPREHFFKVRDPGRELHWAEFPAWNGLISGHQVVSNDGRVVPTAGKFRLRFEGDVYSETERSSYARRHLALSFGLAISSSAVVQAMFSIASLQDRGISAVAYIVGLLMAVILTLYFYLLTSKDPPT